jgi:hypothetical protein
MKINRISYSLLLLAISLSCSINLHAQENSQALSNANQLAEPQEVGPNDIQPLELVMDILGIRPGMIISEEVHRPLMSGYWPVNARDEAEGIKKTTGVPQRSKY